MYRFDCITSVEQMKDVSMFVRIYNEMKAKKMSLLEADMVEYAKSNYGTEVTLYDIYIAKNLLTQITNSDSVPTLPELDNILSEYIKLTKTKAEEVFKDTKLTEVKLNESKHFLNDKIGYTSKELLVVGEPAYKQMKMLLLSLIIAPLLIGLVAVLCCYPLIRNIEIDLDYFLIKNRFIAIYGSLFLIMWLISFGVLYLILRKKIKTVNAMLNLVADSEIVATSDQTNNDIAEENFKEFFKDSKFLKMENGKVVGDDKLFYYLRMDNGWKQKTTEQTSSDEFIEEEGLKNKIVFNMLDGGEVGISSWTDEESSAEEKKLINKDLVARIKLITDSLKKSNQTNCKEFDEITNIYCGTLSKENRDKEIVEQEDQLKVYNFYVNNINLLEKYEEMCKSKYGIDYECEEYSFRVASSKEKQYINNYIFSIIETELNAHNYKQRAKTKFLALYNDTKEEIIKNITYRKDLYLAYFKVLRSFAKLKKSK